MAGDVGNKLAAARNKDQDLDDIAILVRQCDIRSTQEATELYDRYFPEIPIKSQAVAAVGFVLGQYELTRLSKVSVLPPVAPRALEGNVKPDSTTRPAICGYFDPQVMSQPCKHRIGRAKRCPNHGSR